MSAAAVLAAKLLGSLAAILLLGWFARWLDLGRDARILNTDHAIALAHDQLYGFAGVDAVVDRAGYAALVRDADNRHAIVRAKGGNFVTRMLTPPIEGRLDHKMLTIELREIDFAPATLNLGDQAQYWASGLRHIPVGRNVGG